MLKESTLHKIYTNKKYEYKHLIIAFISILTLNSCTQEIFFEKIINKTWFEEDGFAGTTIVFYRTHNGNLKAIRQINGSGVPVISSGIYDVKTKHDTVFLLNGIDLKTSENLSIYRYNIDNVTGQIKQLRILHDYPILYSWIDKRKDPKTQIDVKLLSEIPIGENEIYRTTDLIKTLLVN